MLSAIHQFHDGTAIGDAVTSDMIEIQAVLRRNGFQSEIYATHVAEGLKRLVRPLETYNGDAAALLMVHHSMGFDRMEQILALPDRKILKYHNITPPELLAGGHARTYAAKGRLQLAEYRHHVELGVGVSEYNRQELVELGFRYTDVLPIFFRPSALADEKRDPALARELKRTFNLLFVGRVAPNKRQLDLVRIFDEYRRSYNADSRLWLVGSCDGSEAYRDGILAEISHRSLSGQVTVTGKVSSAKLATYYRCCDVLLCASEHEGFCVPLLEAMAFDVPVVAFAASAVPETLGSAGILLDSKDPDLWCQVIEELRTNPDFRGQVVSRGRSRLSELSLERAEARLLEIVRGLSACSPIDVNQPTMQIQGPFETSYSLAKVNRSLAVALDQQNQFDVSIYCTEGPGDYIPKESDLADKPSAKWLWRKSGMLTERPTVTIRNLYPPRVSDVQGDLNFLHIFWEDSLLPPGRASEFNRYVDGVLAPTHHVQRVMLNSGVTIPIFVVGEGVDERFFRLGRAAGTSRRDRTLTFLNVSSGFPRKGIDLLLQAYFTEFTAADNVQLVVKTFPNPHNEVAAQIEGWRRKCADPPPLVHIDRDLAPEEIDELYRKADCLVYPTRAEGFGLPIAEAMACRIPVIVTAYSGHMDFCSDETAFLVDHYLVPSSSHVAIPGAQWAEPDIHQLCERMRFVFAHRDSEEVNRRVEAAYQNISRNFRWSCVANRVQEIAAAALGMPPGESIVASRRTKLAMVTTWDCRCGIAEYSRYLIDALREKGQKFDIEVLSPPTENIWAEYGVAHTVCWDQRPLTDLSRLRRQILSNGFDIVHFQFNFGFFDLEALSVLIRDLKRASKKVVITFHSTTDVPEPTGVISLARISDSLRDADLLLVHSPDDQRRLASFGISDNVRILPHGNLVYPPQDRTLRRQWGITLDPVIGTFGFLLPNKGLLELLEAVKILRCEFPKLGLMAQCALHRDAISREFERVVRERIRESELQDAVLLSTEFVTPEEAVLFLQLSDVVVMPYKDTRESASGSIRFALASGRPVVTTKSTIFTDVVESAFHAESSDPRDLAAAIRRVLNDPSLAAALAQMALHQAESTSWESVAECYFELIFGRSVTSITE